MNILKKLKAFQNIVIIFKLILSIVVFFCFYM